MSTTYIRYPASSGSGEVPTYANFAALPATADDGALAVTLDNDYIYVYNDATTTWKVAGGPSVILSIGGFDTGTPSADGASISSSNALLLQSASATVPGLVNISTQSFTGVKSFASRINANGGLDVTSTGGSDVLNIGTAGADIINIGSSGATINMIGTTLYENVTNLQVTDKLITVNKGGAAASGTLAGIEVEEGGVITGYADTSGDRNSWVFKAPATAGEAVITPGASGIVIDQSSHNPITLAAVGSSPNANGASLSTQVLNLQPADGSNPGVVSTASQVFAGAKAFSAAVTVNSATAGGGKLNVVVPATTADHIRLYTDDGTYGGTASGSIGFVPYNAGSGNNEINLYSDFGQRVNFLSKNGGTQRSRLMVDGTYALNLQMYVSAQIGMAIVQAFSPAFSGDFISLRDSGGNPVSGIDSNGRSYVPLGALATPGMYFKGDANTGIYSSGADSLSLVTGGVDRLNVGATGTLTVASLTAGALISSAGGVVSNEAQLNQVRGGTGVNNAGTLTYGSNNITLTTSGTTSLTLPASGTLATLAGTEAFTNKTLSDTTVTVISAADATKVVQFDVSGSGTGRKTTFAFSTATTDKTITFPNLSSTVALTGGSQTLSSKTLVDSCVLANTSDTSKTIGWDLSGATTSTKTTFVVSQTTARSITFPNATDTLVGKATTDTLTNKTITTTGNTISGTTAADNAAAGTIGEYVESVISVQTNIPSSATWGDLTSISLTAGDWEVSANFNARGSTLTNLLFGISTTTGNSGTGLVLGSNELGILPPSSTSDSAASISGYRINISSTTTVYFKYQGTFATGTPTAVGRLSARRMR